MIVISILFTLLMACIHATDLPKRVISYDISLESYGLSARSECPQDVDIGHRLSRYMIYFTLGSDKQPMSAVVHTGLSYLNIFSNMYNPETLTTSFNTSGRYLLTLPSARSAGWLIQDQITLSNGASMRFEFGLSDKHGFPIMASFGIAGGGDEKRSIPFLLKNNGYTNKVQYSLYMDESSHGGKLIFGGIDKAKYTGEFVTVPTTKNSALANLEKIKFEDQVHVPDCDVFIDTTTVDGYLKKETLDWLAKLLNATADANRRLYVPCDQPDDKYISWVVLTGAIKIPLKAFAKLDYTDIDGRCYLPFTEGSEAVLGQQYIKYLYTTFDLEAKTLGVALYKQTDASHIVAV